MPTWSDCTSDTIFSDGMKRRVLTCMRRLIGRSISTVREVLLSYKITLQSDSQPFFSSHNITTPSTYTSFYAPCLEKMKSSLVVTDEPETLAELLSLSYWNRKVQPKISITSNMAHTASSS